MQKIVKFFLDLFYAVAGLFGKSPIDEKDPYTEKEEELERQIKDTKVKEVKDKTLEEEVEYWNKK